ncbi:MAG: hypothetical protein MUF54_07915 [Polyangiaceae bacterium]|jgi:hypothetical protein|nr:hypothetical protein [Polyangiaceae bacterium]
MRPTGTRDWIHARLTLAAPLHHIDLRSEIVMPTVPVMSKQRCRAYILKALGAQS